MRAIKPPLRVSEQGFTLLEIMVVVVIIGLLVAAVAPQFMGQIDKAAVGRARQDIRQIETSLNLYRLDNFRYPTTAEGLQAVGAHVAVRIVLGGQEQEAHHLVVGQLFQAGFQRAACRLASGVVTIEAEHHAFGLPE